MLRWRVLTGVPAGAFLILAAFDNGLFMRAVVISAGLFGVAEALWMARQAGHRPVQPFAYLLFVAVLADAAFGRPPGIPAEALGWPSSLAPLAPDAGAILRPALAIVVLGSLAALLPRTNLHGSLTDWGLTLALPLYVSLLQFFVLLRMRSDGGTLPGVPDFEMTWPAMVLATSWTCDITAYFVGRSIGRTRLAPHISPAKSVEGALAGLIGAMMLGVLFHFVTGLHPFVMAGFGFAVAIGSVLGDLVESLLKRQCGVKDSGVLLPGHGGILDRMDALLGAATCAYFYLEAVL